MGLVLYFKEDDTFIAMTDSGDLTSPLTSIHDGKTGDIQTIQVYVRNDDTTLWFSNVKIQPVDLVDANPYGDVVYSETGWGVKLSQGAEEPTEGEWDDIEWGNQIDMANLGSNSGANTTTYLPFWYYITCPPNTDAKVKTDIVLNVSYTENSVV